MRTSHALIASFVAPAIALTPAVAQAMPLFPPTLQSDLCLSHQPPCTICHQGTPGFGTATSGFAEAMKQNGLNFADVNSVAPALDALLKAGTVTNSENIPDIQALEEGLDPNTGATIGTSSAGHVLGDGGCAAPPPLQPEFGCGAHTAPAPASSGSATVLMPSLVFSVWRAARSWRKAVQRRRPHP